MSLRDKEHLGKINYKELHRVSRYITENEVKTSINKLRLSASGGVDGITGCLLKLLYRFLPKLIHRAVKEIANGIKKPTELAEIF